MKYKHIITVMYAPKDSCTLVMHFNIIDKSPAQYNRNDLINMHLSNEIPGQEIWGTYFMKSTVIFPVFYCNKPLGETKMQLKCQSMTNDKPVFELNNWEVHGPSVVSYTSNVIKLND